MQQKTVYIETYGCTANQNNSEILAGILSNNNFIVTNNLEIAEIIIINTCVVKGKTESKIKRRIQDLQKQYKNKLTIITGCMPETDLKKLQRIASKAIFLGTHHFKEIAKLINDYYEQKLDEKKQKIYIENQNETKLNLPKQPKNKLISIQQISEGCLGNCSYCKTRLAKGKLFSYPKEQIIKSIESDLQNGAKEIWLTSQDCASYGLDQKERQHKLPELLKEILQIKHRFKLRLGMADPNNIFPIINELIEIYKDKKMFKFLHIPIQSASNTVLKHMNRFYTIEQAEEIIKKFRKTFPNIVIATDIIVGYPIEQESEHKANLEFIEQFKPEVLNLSKFSSHKQTPAGKLQMLPTSIIRKRCREIMQLHRQTAKQQKEKYLDKSTKVFVDKKISENLYQARDENYNIVILNTQKEDLGKEIDVKINAITVHSLIAEKLKD